MTTRPIPALALSFAAHAALLGGAALLFALRPSLPAIELVDIEVLENPKVAPSASLAPLDLKPKVLEPSKPEPAPVEGRQVFGLSKNALTTDAGGDDAVSVKPGNTLAIAPDDKKLEDGDPDRLPLPTDEYLVTKMAKVVESFTPPYPEAARKRGVEGPVVMDLLIDDQGKVRESRLIRGPDDALNQAAREALMKFRFSPAYVGEKPVAIRVRYTYVFKLE